MIFLFNKFQQGESVLNLDAINPLIYVEDLNPLIVLS